MFHSLFILGSFPAHAEKGAYELPLVMLSYAVAAFASYTALSLARQLTQSQGLLSRKFIFWGGSFALGAGIWSMHFIGMLAYKMNMLMSYDAVLTGASALVAIVSAAGVLFIASRWQMTGRLIAGSAVLLGLGISAMHYIGMAAMKMDADIRYTPGLFALSVFIAVAASAAALWLTFTLNKHETKRLYLEPLAALVMGAAICGMHYTGMAAAVFVPFADCRHVIGQNFDAMAVAIAAITAIILMIALVLNSHQSYVAGSSKPGRFFRSSEALSILVLVVFAAGVAWMVHQRVEMDYRAAFKNYHQTVKAVPQAKAALKHNHEDEFAQSAHARMIRNFEYAGYGFIFLLMAGGIFMIVLLQRNFRLMKANNIELMARLESEQSRQEALAAKTVAEKSNAVKSEFLANMSHELRTPLNSILGMTRLLLETELKKEQKELADTVFQSSSNLLEIVNDILDLSKIEAGEMKLERIGVDLSYIIHGVAHTMDHIANDKNIAILHSYKQDHMPYVLGDPTRISRLLLNLVGNAVKYTEAGYVEIRAFCRPVDDKHVEFRCEVKDTGIGIPKEKHGMIFEKFSQADTSTTRKYGGTGLGLAITKQLVDLMGGKIGLESDVGMGSVFWFTIPFETTDTLADGKRVNRQTMQSGTLPASAARILIAEDQPMNQLLIVKIMQRFGLKNFDVVENGRVAIERYKDSDYDIILMDCHMPEMNGYDATAAVRALEQDSGKHVHIVAMTANAMVGDREKCLRCGMDDYVSKPISMEELQDVLGQWIKFETVSAVKAGTPSEEAAVDLSQLHVITGGDKEAERELAALYQQQSDKNLAILSNCCANDNYTAWQDTAHAMKGGAGGLGAKRLQTLCDQAQHMKNAKTEERKTLLKEIEAEYALVLQFLKSSALLI